MPFTIGQSLALQIADVPPIAKTIELHVTTPSGVKIPTTGISIPGPNSISITALEIGTYNFEWQAKAHGFVVGSASGTFDVDALPPVAMTATVSAAQ